MGWIASRESAELRHEALHRAYDSNPKRCLFCSKGIPYKNRKNSFCNQSCGAKHRHSTVTVRSKKSACFMCGKIINPCKSGLCSFCFSERRRTETRSERDRILTGGGYLAAHATRVHLIEKFGHKCSDCGLTEWKGEPVPLDVHHSDGNYKNNTFDNLRLLCKNCHGITDSFGARNRGNGRAERRARYLKVEPRVGLAPTISALRKRSCSC